MSIATIDRKGGTLVRLQTKPSSYGHLWRVGTCSNGGPLGVALTAGRSVVVRIDLHVNAGAPLSINQLDRLRHRVGIFAAMFHGFEAQASPVHIRVLRTILPESSQQISE